MTTNMLRRLLEQLFKTASELDAYILDFFPNTKNLLTDSMDRTQKINILFEKNSKSEIIKSLHDYQLMADEGNAGETLKEVLFMVTESAIENTSLLKQQTRLELALFIISIALSTAFSRSPITSATVLSAMFLLCVGLFRKDFSLRLRIFLVGLSVLFALYSANLIQVATDHGFNHAMPNKPSVSNYQ